MGEEMEKFQNSRVAIPESVVAAPRSSQWPRSASRAAVCDWSSKPRGRRGWGGGYPGKRGRGHGNQESLVEPTLEESLASRRGGRGGKNIDVTHLMGFSYVPADGHCFGNPPGAPRWRIPRRSKFNKDFFIQANCQFLVKESGFSETADPDTLVGWEMIERVVVRNPGEPLSCPICLYPPIAAKMTRCGHVYCWPCVLHYLALGDKVWRRCPICYDPVYSRDLKSVQLVDSRRPSVAEPLAMVLMCRTRGMINPVPLRVHLGDDDDVDRFGKILGISATRVQREILDEEFRQLSGLLEEESENVDTCFIEQALRELAEREQSNRGVEETVVEGVEDKATMEVKTDADPDLNNSTQSISCPDSDVEEVVSGADNVVDGRSVLEDCLVEDELNLGCSTSNRGSQGPKDIYYFYQSEDGQHVYLNPMCAQMLSREYGGLRNAPYRIQAEVLELESKSMTEEVRVRLRYLAHLPLTCEFTVCELRMTSSLVSPAVLEQFAEDVYKRRKVRQKRERLERRRVAEEQRKNAGATAVPFNQSHFPDMRPRSPLDGSVSDLFPVLESPPVSGVPSSTFPGVSEMSGVPGSAGSFASVVNETPKLAVWPVRRSIKESAESTEQIPDDEADVIVDEDRPPTYRDSFSSALAVALDAAMETPSNASKQRSGKKKKGGRNSKLLFTTSIRQNYN